MQTETYLNIQSKKKKSKVNNDVPFLLESLVLVHHQDLADLLNPSHPNVSYVPIKQEGENITDTISQFLNPYFRSPPFFCLFVYFGFGFFSRIKVIASLGIVGLTIEKV